MVLTEIIYFFQNRFRDCEQVPFCLSQYNPPATPGSGKSAPRRWRARFLFPKIQILINGMKNPNVVFAPAKIVQLSTELKALVAPKQVQTFQNQLKVTARGLAEACNVYDFLDAHQYLAIVKTI